MHKLDYKEYFAKHFGTVQSAQELYPGEFVPSTPDHLAELHAYIKQLQKWTKHLDRATTMREEYTIQHITNEDEGHAHWRKSMRAAVVYSRTLLINYEEQYRQHCDKIPEPQPLPEISDDLDVRCPDLHEHGHAQPRKGKQVRLRPSPREVAQRCALIRKSREQRNAADMRLLNKYIREESAKCLKHNERFHGPITYDPIATAEIFKEVCCEGKLPPDGFYYMVQQLISRISYVKCHDEVWSFFGGAFADYVIKTKCTRRDLEFDDPCIESIMRSGSAMMIEFYRTDDKFAASMIERLIPSCDRGMVMRRALDDAFAFLDLRGIKCTGPHKDWVINVYLASWYIMSMRIMTAEIDNPESHAHSITKHKFLGDDPRNLKSLAQYFGAHGLCADPRILAQWRDIRRKYMKHMRKRALTHGK
jgi:hypothetical protein